MRSRPIIWFLISLLCLVGAGYFWHLGNKWAVQKTAAPVATPAPSTAPAASTRAPAATNSYTVSAGTAPMVLLTKPVAAKTNAANPLAHRLSNTTQTLAQLLRNDRAVLLENALLDTTRPLGLQLPDSLRAPAEPGSYIVQARGKADDAFRAALAAAGATIVSYIPNNAYLVRASATSAQQLAVNPKTQAVLPYEPAYKLKSALFNLAMEEKPLPSDTALNLVVFADAHTATRAELEKLGIKVLAEAGSPFGPILTVVPPAEDWTSLARLPGVELVEIRHPRVAANDLSRARLGVATDTTTATNYLGLTGNGVLVGVNDSGVDASQVDLTPRVTGFGPASLVDPEGHGTHVAGIIASSGGQSPTVTNASGSINPGTNFQYRGKAPGAKIFSQSLGLLTGPVSDFDLQQNTAKTNALISNNSWHYGDDNQYDIGAASFDAAVRDALPYVTGSQPTLYVFAAGNSGFGSDSGLSGDPGSIQSPGTAKNIITVGALEEPRNISAGVAVNCVTTNLNGTNVTVCETNYPWQGMTDSDNEVAWFSSRGNVGIGVEGTYGRFKPDVVAPGTFVVSTRSSQWNEQAYYNPTNHHYQSFVNLVVSSNSLRNDSLFVPDNAVAVYITVLPNADSPTPLNLPIFVRQADIPDPPTYDAVRTNRVAIPPDMPLLGGAELFYSVGNPTGAEVSFNLLTDIVTTNDLGDYYTVLSNLNNNLGPYYRYESGTSMSAADVSGILALMQEFFEQRLFVTNSPALYKALLINGSRSAGSLYSFQVNNAVNFQGWGLPSLPNSIPEALLTNALTPATPAALKFYDQSPTSALATDQSQTRLVTVSDAARSQPLRVTLVWTDPPGNPAASVKLVNDLDLIVTNLDTGEVFIGNDIPSASNFNSPLVTNTAPSFDSVNNVENVYLSPALGTNYSVTVVARHVNVNAVTAQTNNVKQDYALVISSGNGEVADAIKIETQPIITVVLPPESGTTNTFANYPTISGTLIYNQRVGANTALLGTTNGITNQWHFYVLTNDTAFTNAAFVTFLPPPLAVPRMGATNVDDPDQATRIEADIDLYVSTDPGLTNLDPNVIAASDKSRRRGGTEFVVYSNSVAARVYYVGVKSEDQMACEYSFLGVFSQSPFSSRDAEGNLIVNGLPIPTAIPDGTPAAPGSTLVLGLATEPITVRRLIVTNSLFTENLGDLLGNLSHDQKFCVLNNHRGGDEGFYTFVYDDSGESSDLQHTDGPGNLREFVGEEGQGVWLLKMVDDSLTQTGSITGLTLRIEPAGDTNGVTEFDVAPNSFGYVPVNVPLGATNMEICVANLSLNKQPLGLYVRHEAFPTLTEYDFFKVIGIVGDCLNISVYDLPPLQPGRYIIGVFNASGIPQRVRVTVRLSYDLAAIVPLKFDSPGNEPLLDDAVTYSTNFVANTARVAQVEVALRLNHPRVSDLAITLISPRGTRVLLTENRGMTTPDGLGSSLFITNVVPQSANGGPAAQTNVVDTGSPVGSLTIDYNFYDVPDQMTAYYEGVQILNTGMITNSGRINLIYGPGASTQVTFIMNEFGNSATNTLWDYTVSSITDSSSYLIFTENTNRNGTPIKFVAPPFTGTPGTSVLISDFEPPQAAGDFGISPPLVDGWAVLTTNVVTVITGTPPVTVGSQSLALRAGQMERTLTTIPGRNYRLSYAYRAQPSIADILTGPVVNPANNHLYYLLASNDWANAEAQALSLGGQLVTINDASENDWVYTNFSSFGGVPRSLWIGLTDVASEGNFVWLNGDPSTYRNWMPGEPNNGGGVFPNENRVGMRGPDLLFPSQWNDTRDADVIYPVVERTVPGAQIFVPNRVTNTFQGNDSWQTGGLLFTSTTNTTVVGLAPVSGDSGVLLDSFTLTETAGSLYALPEQFLKAFDGESAYGNWTLEVWDSRAGATNPTPALVSWQLDLVFQNTTPLPRPLEPGMPSTNTVPPGQIAYFIIDVPVWANFATNTLIFASGNVNVLFNQNDPPTYGATNVGDYILIPNSTGGAFTLSGGSTPPLLPGRRYYLGVENLTAVTVTFAVRVDFDSTNPPSLTPPPYATTMPATLVNGASAQLNGMATANGEAATAWFQWGTSPGYGASTPPVSVGTNFNVVFVNTGITGLTTNVAIHYRLVVSNVVGVAYGFDQVFAQGSVVAWGADFFGQTTPIPSGLTNLVAGVGAGYDFSLALNYDGAVVAWGDGLAGQTTVPTGLNNAVSVAGGYSHSLALRSDRTVTVWGSNSAGQTNVPPDLTNAVAAASGGFHCLALRDDGYPVAWGLNTSGQTNIPAGLSNVVAVAAGYAHCLAVINDGTVVAWGNNAFGQTNVPAGLTNVVAIAAGHNDSLALKHDGTVVAWGSNANGQTNVPVSLTNVTAIAAGDYHCLALKGDGSVWYWGDSSSGQLNFYPTNLTNVFVIAGGGFHTVSAVAPYGLNLTNTPPYWTNGLDGTTITMDELTTLSVNNAARDSNAPPQLVFYSFGDNPPAWASLDAFSGIITLQPQAGDGPATVVITTVATDNGYPPLSATNRFTVIVNAVNPPPIPISSILYTNSAGTNGFLLTWFTPSNYLFQVQWSDSLTPVNWRTFTNPPVVSYNTNAFTSPTNTQFNFFDDGSQTGGLALNRFYRVIRWSSVVPSGIITLTNGIPYFNTNTPAVTNLDYYRYTVTTNAVRAQFEINGPTGDLTLVARKGLPLPDLANFDYQSANSYTNDELIVIFTNSTPVALSPGDWYLAAVNVSGAPVSYAIKATEYQVYGTNLNVTASVSPGSFCLTWDALIGVHYVVQGKPNIATPGWDDVSSTITATNTPTTYCVTLPSPYSFFRVIEGLALSTNLPPVVTNTIITLTNGIPFFNANAGVGNTNDYYLYTVSTNAVRAQFEINNPTGDLTLIARKGLPLPGLASFDYQSTNGDTNDELIVVFTNSTPVPLSPGDWYLAAVNVSGGPVTYSIKATEWPVSGTNLNVAASVSATNSFCLTWNSLLGAHYYVEGLTNLGSTNWVIVSPTLTATNTQTTWCIGLPTSYQFFRVTEGLALSTVLPPVVTNTVTISSIIHTNSAGTNGFLLTWFAPSNGLFQVLWSDSLAPVNWQTFAIPPFVSYNTNFPASPSNAQFNFFDDGSQAGGLGLARFYRLIRLSSLPPVIVTGTQATSTNFCLTWNSLPGANYHVEGLTNLSSTNWVILSPTIPASGNSTTWCVPLPSPFQFFRVRNGLAPSFVPAPPLNTAVTAGTNGFTITWTGGLGARYQVEWTPTLLPPAWTSFTSIITSANTQFSFLDDGTQAGGLGALRFYRPYQIP